MGFPQISAVSIPLRGFKPAMQSATVLKSYKKVSTYYSTFPVFWLQYCHYCQILICYFNLMAFRNGFPAVPFSITAF